MAKKKTKAARKAAKKKVSEPAPAEAQDGGEAGSCADEEIGRAHV